MVESSLLRKNAQILCMLHKFEPKAQQAIIDGAPKCLLDCISEICVNILKGNVTLSAAQKSKLSQFKDSLRKLSKKSTKTSEKRRRIQKGGFLGALLAPLLGSILKPLAKSILS